MSQVRSLLRAPRSAGFEVEQEIAGEVRNPKRPAHGVREVPCGGCEVDDTRVAEAEATYLRTSDGHEIDLILGFGGRRWAYEIKLTTNPSPETFARLRRAVEIVGAERRVLVSRVVTPGRSDGEWSCDLEMLLRLLRREIAGAR